MKKVTAYNGFYANNTLQDHRRITVNEQGVIGHTDLQLFDDNITF